METKQIIALGLGGLVMLGGGYALSHYGNPVTKIVEVEKPVITEKIVEVTKEVPVEKIVTVEHNNTITVEVPVDNGKLSKVMSFVEDNYDEDITTDYIVFEVDSQVDAESYIRENFKTLLKNEDYFDDGNLLEDYRSTEVSIKKLSDPTVSDRDFDDKDVTFTYDLSLKAQKNDDKEYFNFTVTVPFEKGKIVVEDITIDN